MQLTQIETKSRKHQRSGIGQESKIRDARMNVQKSKRFVLKHLASLGKIKVVSENNFNLIFSKKSVAINTNETSISGGIGTANKAGGIIYDPKIGLDEAKTILKIVAKQIEQGATDAKLNASVRWGQNYFVVGLKSR